MPSKLMRALVALAIVILPVTAFAAAPRNLLVNPGFERLLPGHEWMPAAWDTSDAGMSTVFFGRDTLLKHGGQYGVSIANTSTVFTMGHNWSQTVLVGREAWNKNATFSVWTYSAGQDGRAYILLQAYSDTVTKLARIWDVPRDEALRRFGISPINDPLQALGWKRLQFDGGGEGWVRREVTVFVPEGTNILFARCGLFGTGQVAFDDAALTLAPAPPAPRFAVGQNVLVDPSFEQGAREWEWAVPPFEGAHIERDTTVAHTGHTSMVCLDMDHSPVSTRAGMCQAVDGRLVAGKHVRLTGWFKGDSIGAECYVQLGWEGRDGSKRTTGAEMLHGTFDWSRSWVEADIPADAKIVWAWLQFSAPALGRVWMDDASLEITGPAAAPATPGKTSASRRR
jgi:hypothetical protein